MKDNERRSGRTTRQVYEAIQTLFREGRLEIPKDHAEAVNNKAQENLTNILRKRLNSEHSGQGRVEGEYLVL